MYHYSWVQLLEGAVHALNGIGLEGDEPIAVLWSWMVALFLIVLGFAGRAGLNKARARGGMLQYVPSTGLSIVHVFEIYIESILNMATSVLSLKDAKNYYWLVGGLFIYIFFSNILAVVPGGMAPTSNISNNLAMALVVFVVFNVEGVRRNGLGYFKHMAGPVWWLAPFIFVIELIGVLVRPASLSLRLMGNMVGDHTVFGVMSELVPVVVPSIFLGLGIFISFLQAFVFTLLAAIYIALSVAHEEH